MEDKSMITRNEIIGAIHRMALCIEGTFSHRPAYSIQFDEPWRSILHRIEVEENCAQLDSVEFYNDHYSGTECIDNLNRANLTQVYLAVRQEYVRAEAMRKLLFDAHRKHERVMIDDVCESVFLSVAKEMKIEVERYYINIHTSWYYVY